MSFTYKVERGDCPWNIAEKSLKQQNKKVDNKSIYYEMVRLAELNGCKNVDEFNAKFFSKTGAVIAAGSGTQENVGAKSSKKTSKSVNNSEFLPSKKSSKSVNNSAPLPPKKTSSTVNNSQQIAPKKTSKPVNNSEQGAQKTGWKPIPKYESVEQEVKRINSLENDLTRIIQYNKKHYDGKHYAVVDKKTCQLTVYDKDGKVVQKFVVGVGKTKGDGLSNYFTDYNNNTDKAGLAEQNRYTTPGEFTLDEKYVTKKSNTKGYTGTDGKYRLMDLKGDNRGVNSGQQAIHVVYKNDADRIKAIKSDGTEDNRMSYGCINLLQEDYDKLHEYLGEGDKVFILPEEKGNKLQLEKQSDGSYIFHQQNHKDDARDYSVEAVSRVKYDVHPERDKSPKKAKGSRKHKSQQNPQYPWYDPRTWLPKQFNFRK